MRTIIIVGILCAIVAVCAQNGATKHEIAARQECLDKGGFPISKGPRSYDYHCFAKDPTIK